MRPIEFRAWDTKSNCWRYWDIQKDCMCDLLVYGHLDLDTLGQFIGLLDAKGKKIWEGDKVRCYDEEGFDTEIYEVEYCYDRNYPAFDLKGHASVDCNAMSYYMALGGMEVIGNIYEKPEVLQGG